MLTLLHARRPRGDTRPVAAVVVLLLLLLLLRRRVVRGRGHLGDGGQGLRGRRWLRLLLLLLLRGQRGRGAGLALHQTSLLLLLQLLLNHAVVRNIAGKRRILLHSATCPQQNM